MTGHNQSVDYLHFEVSGRTETRHLSLSLSLSLPLPPSLCLSLPLSPALSLPFSLFSLLLSFCLYLSSVSLSVSVRSIIDTVRLIKCVCVCVCVCVHVDHVCMVVHVFMRMYV